MPLTLTAAVDEDRRFAVWRLHHLGLNAGIGDLNPWRALVAARPNLCRVIQ
jgi:hypothetical protein